MNQDTQSLRSKRKSSMGFTLIEIVAVMAIIGVMTVALMPSIDAAMNRSKNTKMISELSVIDGGIKVYQLDNDKLPASLEVLISNKYIPNKSYTDAAGTAISYDASKGIASGVDTNGNTVYSNGNVVVPEEDK